MGDQVRMLLVSGVLFLLSCGGEEQEVVSGERQDDAEQIPVSLDGSLQNPAWSPDGDAIVMTRFRNGYNEEPADIFIVEVGDGSSRELVRDGSGNVNLPGAVWNGETEQIVFSSSREPHDEIFVIDDGGDPGDEEPITDRDDLVAYEPSLSPDGEWVVFESHVLDEEDNGVIMRFRVDGSGDYEALTDPDDDCRQPNWSPAGGKILYQRYADGEWNIWTINEDGSDPQQVTEGPGDSTDASFSPDGEWIVYSADRGELEFANIYVIPSDGGEPVRVTRYAGYDGAPSFSPDGTKIAFESFPGDPDDSAGTTLWVIHLGPVEIALLNDSHREIVPYRRIQLATNRVLPTSPV